MWQLCSFSAIWILAFIFIDQPRYYEELPSTPIPNKAETGRQIKVAIIDAEIDPHDLNLCSDIKSYDFTTSSHILPEVSHYHPNVVSAVINKTVNGQADYCVVNYSVFPAEWNDVAVDLQWFTDAVNKAVEDRVDIINMSFGLNPNIPFHKALYRALSSGIKVVVASGNNGKNLDFICSDFPTCYFPGHKNMFVIGGEEWGLIPRFNYGGPVKEIYTACYLYKGRKYCGTSFSAPVKTGKLVLELSHAK